MCRFIAYIGAPMVMNKLLYEPKNSLIHQSYKAQEREEPLNGDGFGVGWYERDIEPTPAVFVSVSPAWNDRNLRYIAPKLRSRCMFAHVRAASAGGVTQGNCHPFHFKNLLMMHNGDIGGFSKLKRLLRRRLSDPIYDWIQGETDSQHFFALFLDNLTKSGAVWNTKSVVSSIETTIADMRELAGSAGIADPALLNVAITDGNFVVASRYVSDPKMAANTLYHSEGGRYECHDGVCSMLQTDPAEHSVLIVSEKLTDVKEDWHAVPVNHFVTVDESLQVGLRPIQS